jgi:hypothetical protein
MTFSDRTLLVIACAAVLAGCVLRLAWPGVMEYKADEQYMFERSQRVGVSEPWPALGMPSGAGGVPNPALSVWSFAGLARLSGAATPVALARTVATLNCLGLVALTVFAWRGAGGARRVWLWTVSLAALAPTAILVQRKIWAQSLLPLFALLMLAAWTRRRTFGGALLWAALALVAGQIHMTGFIFFVALTLWTLVFWRDSMHWRGWLAGVLLGGLSAVPWLQAVLLDPHHSGTVPRLFHFFSVDFWWLWITEAFGLGLRHNLGTDWSALMRRPTWGGHDTWLVGLAELGLAAILLYFLTQVVRTGLAGRPAGRGWRAWLAAVGGAGASETTFLVRAMLVAYGVLLSLPDFNVFRHYLLITFPLAYLWPAAAAESADPRRRRWNEGLLLAALVLNLFVTVQLFGFLQRNGGAPGGDFGVSWRAQQAETGGR